MLNAKDYQLRDCGSDVRRMYEFNGTTPRGERVIAEISECYPDAKGWSERSLPVLWHKKGWTKELLPSYLCLHTYVYDKDGQCWGLYNPQDNETWDGKRWVINFDWMLPVSDENRNRMLAEVVRRANAGEGVPMEPITEHVKDEFKADHDAFRWEWDEQKMRSRYTAHALIRHLLLACEVYYDRKLMYAGDFFTRLHYVYPDVTEEDVMKVYDRYANIVTAIYG